MLSDGPGRLGFELLNYNHNLGRRQRGVLVRFKGEFLLLDLQIVLVSSLFFCLVFFAFFVVNFFDFLDFFIFFACFSSRVSSTSPASRGSS